VDTLHGHAAARVLAMEDRAGQRDGAAVGEDRHRQGDVGPGSFSRKASASRMASRGKAETMRWTYKPGYTLKALAGS
jgi:hypothetical protein